MATTPKGIYYPTAGDVMTPLANRFAALASSVDDAITNIESAGHFVGTDAQRISMTAPQLRKGVTFYTSDTNLMYLYNGSAWVVWQRMAAPYAVAAGSVSVGGGAWSTVTFPSGRFNRAPLVIAQMYSGAGVFIGHSAMITNTTATNFMTRVSSSGGVRIDWFAIQMTQGTAAG